MRDKEADDRIKKQEMVARQAEKDKRNELKMSLDKMEQDMTADMQTMKEVADIEVRSMRQLIREFRQDVKVVEDQREGLRELLGEVEEKHAIVKTKQDKVMKTLNERNLRLEQKQKERDECIVVLEGGVKEKIKRNCWPCEGHRGVGETNWYPEEKDRGGNDREKRLCEEVG